MLAQFGKYTLLNKIGDGGMAEVFLAQFQGPNGFSKMVALKRMLPHLSHDQAFTRSFINEARLGGYLNHHNIVQTIEFGQIDEFYYLAMEYVRGVTLEDVLRAQKTRREPLPIPLALRIAIQIADGLAYAHSAEDAEGRPLKMVHRDLKPSNILINNHGGCKISDFGVARSEASSHQTVFGGELKGTVAYMSPEQSMGERNLDSRSDVFSLGTILFEMLANDSLYPQESYLGTLRAAQDCEIEGRLASLEGLPHADRILPVLRKLLARTPDERYATAHDVSNDLNDVVMLFEPEWELADYLKALLPKSALNVRTTIGIPVMPTSTPSSPGTGMGQSGVTTSGIVPLAAAGENSGVRGNPNPSVTSMPGMGAGAMGASGGMQSVGSEPISLLTGAPSSAQHGQSTGHLGGAYSPGLGENSSSGRHPNEGLRITHPQLREPNSGWTQLPQQGEISQTMNRKGAPPKPTWQRPEIIGGAVAVLIAVVVAIFFVSGPSGVELTSQPPGASITTWDGRALGVTPVALKVPDSGLPVEISLAGFQSRRLTLSLDQPRVMVQLERARARLEVSIQPSNAAVELDGELLSGSPPYTRDGLNPGKHTLVASLTGFSTLTQDVELKSGATETLSLTLRPENAPDAPVARIPNQAPVQTGAAPASANGAREGQAARQPRPNSNAGAQSKPAKEAAPAAEPGYLTLNAFPYAAVEIDGQAVRTTPLVKHPLPPGNHSVRLKTSDGREKSLQLSISSGQTEKRIVRFDAE